MLRKALYKNGYVIIASSVLLKPNKKYYKNFIEMVKKSKLNFDCYSAPDEQYITYFMSLHKNGPKHKYWNTLSECYQFIPWHFKKNDCCNKKIFCNYVYVMHIFGQNLPWESKNPNEWEDLAFWFSMFKNALKNYNISLNDVYIKYPETIKISIKYNIFHKIAKLK